MTMRTSNRVLDQWWKAGGAAGILFVIVFIIAVVILQGDTPMPDDSAAEIKKYFTDHPNRYMVGDFVIGFAFLFLFLPFASTLRAFLGRAEGPDGVWSRLVFAGALLFTAVGAATGGFYGALAYSAGNFTDDNLLKTLTDANYYTFTLIVPYTAALMVFAASLAILTTRVLSRWLGYFGLAFTLIAVLSALAVLDDDPMGPLGLLGFVAFIALGVWLLFTGWLLIREEAPPAVVV